MQFHKRFESIVSSRLYVSLILFLVSFTIFAPSLNNDFVWDDIVYIKENIERLKDYSPGLSKLIPRKNENKATGNVGIWRPVLISSWALDSKLWGLSSFGFHLSNIVLHCVSTVLVFLFCSMILSRFNIAHGIKISGLAGLIFAVHPVHVETVSFISARSDLLCAIFILLAMIFLVLSYNKLYLLLASFPFFYLALLSKETAIVVPLLALCLVLLKDYKSKKLSVVSIIISGSFMLLLVLYYIARSRRFSILPDLVDTHFIGPKMFSYELVNYINYVLISTSYYINKLIYPLDFNVFVGKLEYNLINVTASYVMVALIAGFLFVSIKKKQYLIFYFVIWILITLLPAIGVSLIKLIVSPFSERFIYIPSIGFSIVASLLIFKLVDFQKYRQVKIGIICMILVLFAVFTVKQQFVWKNNLTLWSYAVRKSPGYISPHLNYGTALLESGDLDGALEQLLKANDPKTVGADLIRVNAANNLGNLYIRKQEFDLAEKYFRAAYDLDDRYEGSFHYHMGLINFMKGDIEARTDKGGSKYYYDKAIVHLIKSLESAPRHGKLNLMLSELYLRIGDRKQALDYARWSLQGGTGRLDENLRKRAQEIINMLNK